MLVLALAAPCAFAVDGVVLINQSTVMAAGGFPYTISQPGSYKLSGNLIINDPNKDVIVIAADRVSLDLGGFSILGPTDCSGGLSPCNNNGTGSGSGRIGPGSTSRSSTGRFREWAGLGFHSPSRNLYFGLSLGDRVL